MPRGRPAGWKKAQVLGQQSLADEASASLPEAEPSPQPGALPAHARENPALLVGDELRALAHRRGLARSDLVRMSDDKIREQLKYLTYRQYEDEVV